MQSNTATEMQQISPKQFLTQIAFGAMMTQALGVAAKLEIADLLKDSPKSVGELGECGNFSGNRAASFRQHAFFRRASQRRAELDAQRRDIYG
jgi:hypothetical protein